MPYTPPAQSPASSKSSSPVISRSSSYHQDDVPRSPSTLRPQPPRSMSSASYLHKHRRSPSIGKSEAPPTPTDIADSRPTKVDSTDFAHRGSLRQSPPPVNNLRIPTGVVISPPDSSENSDGDEGGTNGERGRELQKNWHQLQEAVRSLPQQREHSPEKAGVQIPQSTSLPVSQTTSPTALSAEARKISHSRSSTETRIMHKPTFVESSSHTSDDSDEDDVARFKPSLVRKKSGELVKPALRPSSRRRYSSMPGTPTYSKSVHFNDNDNQTRHFLQVDKPIAVSAGSSPVESYDSESEFPFHEDMGKPELQIKVANLRDDDFSRKTKPIRVERIFLSSDRNTLVGVCAAQNISFQKLVVARFTLDYWKTTSEVVAEFNNDPRTQVNDGCDRFIFHIKLSDQANIDSKTLLLCVRYNVGGQEFWDNNDNTNYQIDFSKAVTKVGKPIRPAQHSPLGQRPLSAIPRSRHTPPSSRGGRPESVDDDFVSRFDTSSAYSFGSAAKLVDDSSTSIKLKPKTKRASILPSGLPSQPTNGLGSRYDFGNSLSAALTSAQDHLGRRSGLVNGAMSKPQSNGSYFGPVDRVEPAKVDAKMERPDAMTTDRPAMGSDQYRDLVQKFCYFTSGSGKGTTSPQNNGTPPSPSPQQKAAPSADGTVDDGSVSSSSSSSGTTSPVHELEAKYTPARSPFVSRSASPASATGQDLSARSASPVSFGYPYHTHRDGYLSDTPTPTAIRG